MRTLLLAGAAALTFGLAAPEKAEAGGFAISIGSPRGSFAYSSGFNRGFNRGFGYAPIRNVGYGRPFYGHPGYGRPVYGRPVYGRPVYGGYHPRPVYPHYGHYGYRPGRGGYYGGYPHRW